MKKIIALCLCLLVVALCFTGCKYAGRTEGYKLYDKFANNHEAGMTKQEVLDELGLPEWYGNEYGQGFRITAHTPEEYEANILSNQYTKYVYRCLPWAYSTTDSGGFYQLTVYFDSEGKSIEAWMVGIS